MNARIQHDHRTAARSERVIVSLRPLTLVALLSIACIAAPPSGTGQTSCKLAWRAVHSPKPRGANLSAVFALSRTNAWAVGGPSRAQARVLVEHWNGRSWTRVSVPVSGSLSGISGTSARDVWAVGSSGGGSARPLVLHFDGRRWTAVPLALPGGRRGGLGDVLALGAGDVWVVGEASLPPPQPDQHGLVAHWNGSAWTTELIGGVRLSAISGNSATDIWSVGPVETLDQAPYVRATVAHWNGRTWTSIVPGFVDDLYGVTALASGDVWAAGAKYGTATHQVVARWNGERWSRRMLSAADWLDDVDGTSPANVWAVGYRDIVHWNGKAWKRTAFSAELTGIDALTSRDAWAVGADKRGPLILRYGCR